MARRHPPGQASVETIILLSFMATAIILLLSHLTFSLKVMEKKDFIKEVKDVQVQAARKK